MRLPWRIFYYVHQRNILCFDSSNVNGYTYKLDSTVLQLTIKRFIIINTPNASTN